MDGLLRVHCTLQYVSVAATVATRLGCWIFDRGRMIGCFVHISHQLVFVAAAVVAMLRLTVPHAAVNGGG